MNMENNISDLIVDDAESIIKDVKETEVKTRKTKKSVIELMPSDTEQIPTVNDFKETILNEQPIKLNKKLPKKPLMVIQSKKSINRI